MRVLLDHCVAKDFALLLPGHQVETARSCGWDKLSNGKLLAAASESGFEVMVTVDRSLRHQQNPGTLPIPVILMLPVINTLEFLAPIAPEVLRMLGQKLPPRVHVIERHRG